MHPTQKRFPQSEQGMGTKTAVGVRTVSNKRWHLVHEGSVAAYAIEITTKNKKTHGGAIVRKLGGRNTDGAA